METETTHTPADTAMENLAALDMLARQWGENSPVVERFERAVNSHAELLEACQHALQHLKPSGNIRKDFSGHLSMATLSRAIAKAEGR